MKRAGEDAFDLERAVQADFAVAVERLGADELRLFLREAVGRGQRRPTGRVHHVDASRSEESLAMAFLEFAAGRLEREPWGHDDPMLIEDARAWSRAAKHKGRADVTECRALAARARRLLLCGRGHVARECYEAILALFAELEDGEHVRPAQLAAPAFFGNYLVSVYEDSDPSERVEAILDAVVRLSVIGSVPPTLKLLEDTAVRPLDDFGGFTRGWASALESILEDQERVHVDGWMPSEALLAEALERIDGLEGVARMARRSRDLSHYRTWILRLAEEAQWSAALAVVEEAAAQLGEAVARGIVLDAGVGLAHRGREMARAVELAERALDVEPTLPRLVRWLLIDEPDRDKIIERARKAKELGGALSARMRALIFSVLGAFREVALLLQQSGDRWDDEEHPGRVAFPALLIAFYGGPKGTPIASRLCAPLFGVRHRGSDAPAEDWHGWDPGQSMRKGDVFAPPGAPSPGPAIVAALHDVESSQHHASDLEVLPAVLRSAAARRAGLVLAHKERAIYDSAALLVVSAAEATFRAGDQDLARAYLGEVAQAATRHSTFRSALTRTLAKSALVNAL